MTDASKRVLRLSLLLAKVMPIPDDWIVGRDKPRGTGELTMDCKPCCDWRTLINAWKRAFKWTDGLDCAFSVMLASITSTKALGSQLWVMIVAPPSAGKSSLCEALSINRKFIYPKSTLRGFHSGYDDGSGENHSLIEKIKDKTLVVKDGDAMLQAPNLPQILSEARDLYDTVSRSSYRNKQSKDHQGVRATFILCGTSSLRYIDTSEVGQRFVTCAIMEGIDPELEDEVLNKVMQKMYRGMSLEADGTLESQQDPEMVRAMQLTGGYVDYLRNNARDLLAGVTMDEAALESCKRLGKFVSYLRARPSKTQNEIHEREFSSRLAETFGRLAMCLAVVLNRNSVDAEVMRRTLKVALDTARGTSLNIAGELFEVGRVGLEVAQLRSFTKDSEAEIRKLLKFLWHIGAVESYRPVSHRGVSSRARWRLTPTLTNLYATVVNKPVPTFEEEEG